MTGELLPLFPLGQPLLPKSALPLRIFEPRYTALLADVTGPGGDHLFGVVALDAGLEVQSPLTHGDNRFADVGTVAEIVQVETAADGSHSNVLAVGRRRFRIRRVVDGAAPYLCAEVNYLREFVGTIPDGLPDAAQLLVAEYGRLLTRLAGTAPDERLHGYPRDPVALSYQLTREAPITPADRQELLATKSAEERLQHLVRLVRREIALVRQTRSVAVAPAVLRAALGGN